MVKAQRKAGRSFPRPAATSARAAAAALVLFLASGAFAADLNAPVDQRPTLGSEIKHGYDAGAACHGVRNILYFDQCFEGVVNRYRVANPNSDAFEAGLSLSKWETADILYQAVSESGGGNVTTEALGWQGAATLARFDAVDRLRHLGLTEAQLFEATGEPQRARFDSYDSAGPKAAP